VGLAKTTRSTTKATKTTTTTTSPQKRKKANSAVTKETTTKQRSLPLTRRKDPPELPPLHQQQMPTLRPVRSTHTPAPSPPKLLTLPGELDPFHPLDHTKNHDPPTHDIALFSQVAAAATINSSNDDISYDVSHSSSSLERSVGRKGSFSDEDDSKDPSYKAPESDDDGLFYSDDEILDAEFERGLDEVARAIEFSDPNRINHGHRRTTVIAEGPAQPDYTGMTAREKDNAKTE